VTTTNKAIPAFHLAFPVNDIEEARKFYSGLLGCPEGRIDKSTPCSWVDFDLYGHQIVAHLAPSEVSKVSTGEVDGKDVPVRHFGVVLSMEQWEALAQSLKEKKVQFAIEPCIRFKGEPGEQATMFFYDPSGNALEFKAFRDVNQLFAK